MSADHEVWLTPAQAAWRAGCSVPTIRLWTRTRDLTFRWRAGGKREYLQASLDALLAADEEKRRPWHP